MNDTTHSVFDSPACCIYLSNFRRPKKGEPTEWRVCRAWVAERCRPPSGRKKRRDENMRKVGKGLQGLDNILAVRLDTSPSPTPYCLLCLALTSIMSTHAEPRMWSDNFVSVVKHIQKRELGARMDASDCGHPEQSSEAVHLHQNGDFFFMTLEDENP